MHCMLTGNQFFKKSSPQVLNSITMNPSPAFKFLCVTIFTGLGLFSITTQEIFENMKFSITQATEKEGLNASVKF